MTLATTSSTAGPYNCNGATVAFSYAWKILDDDEIEVTLISSAGVRTVLTKTTHYTVSGVGVAGGGTVTTVSTYATGNSIYLRRLPPLTQTSEFQNQGAFNAASNEEAFDKLAMQVQYLRDESGRAFKVAVGADEPDPIGTYDDLVADVVADVGADAVALVTAQGVTSTALVAAQGVTSVAAVAAQGVTSIGLVETEGTDQVALVEAEGTAQLALIAAANAADLYADTTAGLAATSSGSYFATPGTNGAALNYYLDSAGTAVLVAQVWGSDAANPQTLNQVRARYDTQVARDYRDYPALLPVRMYAGTLSTGSVNADGTYPLAAGATWVSANLSVAPFNVAGNIYLYAVLTGEQTGALEVKIHQAGTIIKAGNTVTQPAGQPGVYKQTWSNTAPLSHVTVTITNVSASTVNLYPIELYQTDSDYLPQVLSMAETIPVPENRRIVDWDLIAPHARWGLRDNAAAVISEADIDVAFDSVSGSDAAAGTRFAPFQTLAAGSTLTQGQVVGFKRSGVWRESYGDLGTSTKGLRLRNYGDGRVGGDLPVIKGCQSLTGATWALESGSCWKTVITTDAAATAYDGYSYIKVIETTVADADATPLAATKALTRASSKANCIATTGSFFVENTTSTTRTIYVNPNDATIPSSSTLYTYEATDRYCVVNWTAGQARQGVMQGIEVYDSAFGYGAISGGPQSMFSGIIASHGGTHTLKMEAGEIRDFILYNKGTVSSTANCYISPNANGYSWRWTNGMAFNCYPSVFYSHSAAGTYDSGEYSYCWVNGERQSNGALIMGDGFVCDSVTDVLVEWCYVKGYQRNGRAGTYVAPANATLRNCLFRELGIFFSHKLTQNCIVQTTNQSDPDSVNNRNQIMCRLSEDHIVEKCIVHAVNDDVSGYAAGLSDYSASIYDIVQLGANTPTARKNIFLVETDLATSQSIVQETGAAAWASDTNVYIFCVKAGIVSFQSGGGGSKFTVADYLAEFTGHDAASLFVDLRDDPRGAQAVFMDPANGDYRWAQTNVAKAIKAYCIANDVGPDWTLKEWPTMPTVDEARALLAKAY